MQKINYSLDLKPQESHNRLQANTLLITIWVASLLFASFGSLVGGSGILFHYVPTLISLISQNLKLSLLISLVALSCLGVTCSGLIPLIAQKITQEDFPIQNKINLAKEEIPNEVTLNDTVLAQNSELLASSIQRKLSSPTEVDPRFGLTPLENAIRGGNLDIIRLCVAHLKRSNLSIDTPNTEGRTPLDFAAHEGNIEAIYYLVSQQAALHKAAGQKSALFYAIANGKVASARALLKLGIEVDHRDSIGATALHWAVFHNQAELVTLLLSYGANMQAQDRQLKTPLHWLALFGSARSTPKNRVKILQKLLTVKSVSYRDQEGRLPLHAAALKGNRRVGSLLAEFMREEGLSLDSLDAQGQTPLHLSEGRGDQHFSQMLREKGASSYLLDADELTPEERLLSNPPPNINHQDALGYTELHYAIVHNDLPRARKLLHQGINLHLVDKQGRSAIHRAAAAGNVEALSLLLDHNAFVNRPDPQGNTPLHLAAKKWGYKAAEVLSYYIVKNGYSLNLQNLEGKTAFHIAAIEGNSPFAYVLIECGADLYIKDNEGHAPEHYVWDFEIKGILLRRKIHRKI